MSEYLQQYSSLHAASRKMSTEEWIEFVASSTKFDIKLDEITMPAAPADDIQIGFHGVGGRDAILAAKPVYEYTMHICRSNGLDEIKNFLDFGCGWGRFMRLFIRDVAEGGLYGIDPWTSALQMARIHFPHAAILQSSFLPPLPFRNDFFDVVFANSVFSHLPEHLALAWILEILRILRPQGILVATTHPSSLLTRIHSMKKGESAISQAWHQHLCQAMEDIPAIMQKHTAGEYIYINTGGIPTAPANSYGDAWVPEEYIKTIWGNFMNFVDFIDSPASMPQATFALQKKG